MNTPRFTIKKLSVEEQHEEFVTEIKKLKQENEALKKIIIKLTFQTAGITNVFLQTQKTSDSWEQVES